MKEKDGEHPFGDAGQLILFVIFIIVWAGDSFFLHFSTMFSDSVPLFVRIIISVLLMILAVFLTRAAHFIVKEENRYNNVISSGVFKQVRHPLYLGSIMFFLALVCSTISLLSIGLFIVIFIFYNHIASYEEKLLVEKFSDEYKIYKQKTGRWFPNISKNK